MVAFLSDEWCAAIHADGLTLRDSSVEVVVGAGAAAEVKLTLTVAGGALSALVGGRSDADVSLGLTRDDAVAIAQGQLEPTVAFMQGRMKTAGDNGLVLDVLRAASSPAFRDARATLAATTDF
jgi:putative sterol carrier protein